MNLEEREEMTNRFLISVATAALLASTGFANAQGAGGMKEGGAGAGAAQHSAPAPSAGGGAATQQRDDSGMKSGQSDRMRGKEAQDTKSHDSKANKDMKAEGREGREKSTVGQAPDKGGAATKGHDEKAGSSMSRDDKMGQKGEKGATDTNRAQQNQGTMDNNRAQTNQTGSQSTTGQAGAGAKLSSEQQTKISTAIKSQHVTSVNNVNFSLNVGTRVPRSGVEFHVLPQEVVTIYPQWRGYKFIVVKEEIVIIDPNSYEIVAVIPA
jgi:hypothetical protein